MQLVGGEKRIQALFCELSREDQSIAPRFDKLWKRAETMNPRRERTFSRSFAMIAAGLAVAVLCSLVLWLRFRSVETVHSVDNKPQRISTSVEYKILLANGPKKQKRVMRQRKVKRAVTNEALAFSSWQSPTEILMELSSSAILKTSPQLNQSVKELESFLPNEVKETKQ